MLTRKATSETITKAKKCLSVWGKNNLKLTFDTIRLIRNRKEHAKEAITGNRNQPLRAITEVIGPKKINTSKEKPIKR
jgi:hypothetical protein